LARNLETLDEDWAEYIPDFDDNREDENPVSVELRWLKPPDFKAIQRLAMAPLMRGKKDAIVRATQALQDRVLSECVRSVRNYSLPGVGRIVTGEQLAKHGESFIVDDVYNACINLSKLSEGLKKKSHLQSASSLPVMSQPGNGAARDAKATPVETPSVQFATATRTPTQA